MGFFDRKPAASKHIAESEMEISGPGDRDRDRGPIRTAMTHMSRSIMSGFGMLDRSNPSANVPLGNEISHRAMTAAQIGQHAEYRVQLARYTYDTSSMIGHAFRWIRDNGFGDGPKIQWDNDELAGVFDLWSRTCDWNGNLDWGLLLGAGGMDSFVAGDVFLRLVPVPFDGKTIPLKLQMIPSEMVPRSLNRQEANGDQIIQGIVYRAGQKIGYMVYNRPPSSRGAGIPLEAVFVSARDMYQIIDIERPNAVRGVTKALTAFMIQHRLDSLIDNTVKKAQLQTLLAGFIKSIAGSGTTVLPNQVIAPDGRPALEWEGGLLLELPEGKDIVFSNFADAGSSLGPTMKVLTQILSLTFDIPYSAFSNDYATDGDRTGQLVLTVADRALERIQSRVGHQAVSPMLDRLVEEAVLHGLWDPNGQPRERWSKHKLSWPVSDYKHPVQNVTARSAAIDVGLTSRDTIIQEGGQNPRDVDLTNARSMARAMLLGIKYDGKTTFTVTELSQRLIDLEFVELDAAIRAAEMSDPNGSKLDPKGTKKPRKPKPPALPKPEPTP